MPSEQAVAGVRVGVRATRGLYASITRHRCRSVSARRPFTLCESARARHSIDARRESACRPGLRFSCSERIDVGSVVPFHNVVALDCLRCSKSKKRGRIHAEHDCVRILTRGRGVRLLLISCRENRNRFRRDHREGSRARGRARHDERGKLRKAKGSEANARSSKWASELLTMSE